MTPSSSAPNPSNDPRVVLVGVDFGPGSSFDPTLDELALLAESAGDQPVAKVTAKRRAPDAALF
ncbi:MAG: GTPase HflX, partial [Aquabacterium sp.]|nr:GTPase HflX [Aquabacterium sp.]